MTTIITKNTTTTTTTIPTTTNGIHSCSCSMLLIKLLFMSFFAMIQFEIVHTFAFSPIRLGHTMIRTKTRTRTRIARTIVVASKSSSEPVLTIETNDSTVVDDNTDSNADADTDTDIDIDIDTPHPIPPNYHILILPGIFQTQKQYTTNHNHNHHNQLNQQNNQNNNHNHNHQNNDNHESFQKSLMKCGWSKEQIHIIPINIKHWLSMIIKSITDIHFWFDTKMDDPSTSLTFCWYLTLVKDEIYNIYRCFESDSTSDSDSTSTSTSECRSRVESRVESKTKSKLLMMKNEEEKEQLVQGISNHDDDDDRLKIILIGHSAGGWLARATLGFMLDDQTTRRNDIVNMNGDGDGNGNGNGTTDINQDKKHTIDLLSYITGIVTLGTPHISPKPGCMDITRGALRVTNERFPGSYYAPNISYMTVIGDSIKGQRQQLLQQEEGKQQQQQQQRTNNKHIPIQTTNKMPPSSTTATTATTTTTTTTTKPLEVFAYESYLKVCGDGNKIGDGVVPSCAGHLDGATQITLKGVQHSHNFPGDWYGSSNVIHLWHDVMVRQMIRTCSTSETDVVSKKEER